MEIQILDALQKIRTDFLDTAFSLITLLGDGGVFWIVFTLVLLAVKKTRRMGIVLCMALIIDALLCNLFLKPVIARTRPYDINTAVNLIVKKPNDYSFPSGHTAASFTCTTGLFFFRIKKFWIPALVLSVLIAFSRLYLYVHYPTDVLGGIMLGISAGTAAWFIYRKIYRQDAEALSRQ